MADPTLVAFGVGDAISGFVGDMVSWTTGLVLGDPLRSVAAGALGGGGLAKYYGAAGDIATAAIAVGGAFVAGRLVGPAVVTWLLGFVPEVPL